MIWQRDGALKALIDFIFLIPGFVVIFVIVSSLFEFAWPDLDGNMAALIIVFVIFLMFSILQIFDREINYSEDGEFFMMLSMFICIHPLGIYLLINTSFSSSIDRQFFNSVENLLLYSLDQFAKGALFDILEGIKISLADIVFWLFDKKISTYEVEPRSIIAIWDAIYRSSIASLVLLMIIGYMREYISIGSLFRRNAKSRSDKKAK